MAKQQFRPRAAAEHSPPQPAKALSRRFGQEMAAAELESLTQARLICHFEPPEPQPMERNGARRKKGPH
jgi:hypothetical protein